jgi:hypothetical protein
MNTLGLISLILNTLLGGVILWLTTRKKTKAEVKKFEADELEVRVRIAERLVSVHEKDAETSRREKEELIRRIAELQVMHTAEVNEVNRSCAEQMRDMSQRKDEKIEDLEIENAMLKNQLSNK